MTTVSQNIERGAILAQRQEESRGQQAKHSLLEAVMGPDADDLPMAVRGEGVYIFDEDGKRYLDAAAGCFVSMVGHGVPEIVNAIAQQLESLSYMHWSQMSNKPAIELADLILGLNPGHTHAHFVSSGSEAVEASILAANLYHRACGRPERHKVLSREGSYHGATIGAMNATGVSGLRWPAYEQTSFRRIARNTCGMCPFNLEQSSCGMMCASDLERMILAEGPRTVSAFIADPSSSWGWPPADYWTKIREICDRYDIVFIADEVKSGFGKTGRPFALQHYDVRPDITVFGKSAAGGYAALAGITVAERIGRCFVDISNGFPSGHTFANHPVSCAAALATQRYVLDRKLMDRVPQIESMVAGVIRPLMDEFPIAWDFHSMGLLSSLWVKQPPTAVDASPLQRNRKLRQSLAKNGVVTWVSSGPGYSRIQFCPPFIFDEEHVRQLGRAVRSTLEDIG